MTDDREFDLVLFGASGFVGRLTAEHLARHAPGDLRIALAGRSRERLEAARADLPEPADRWPVLVVDATDEGDVADLASRTRTVVTTVGPYVRYGRLLLGACAAAGTHCCDLTGEVLFVREAIDRHHARAESTGARIVNSCGFDSVPSDLGVLVTARRAAADGEGTLTDTVLRVRSLRGGLSGGTIDSMRQQMVDMSRDSASREQVRDPYGLSPDRQQEPTDFGRTSLGGASLLDRLRASSPVRRDEATGRWSAPFAMAPFNTRIVRRSNALTGWSYGRGLRYSEVSDTGSGLRGAGRAVLAGVALGGLAAGMSLRPTRAVLDRFLPDPGEGPSEETRDAGRFVLDIEASTTTGARYTTRVAADADPGYSGTAIMLGEAALAVAVDGAAGRLPQRAGVLTPATALGEVLVDRLRARGFIFETRRADRDG
ncbi:MAG: saccharopine dehydrogenase NADP-binding domain-containing protein [Nesterenkonia sp.]|nr:saccharopine dehydrogenase NADP-binding domain-containing protein [Nesterenkonia sp.]